jgi:two-component system, LytTR family, sensor kinase
MRQLFGDEYALMVETAPGAGMKVTLRVPKFAPGVRTELPDYSAAVPPQKARTNGSSPAAARHGS